MTLTEFLLARIGEEEVAALDAIAKRDRINYVHPPEVPDLAFEAFEDIGVPCVIVGPERVLRDVEAKRRIVEASQFDDAPESAVDWWLQPENAHIDPGPGIRNLAYVLRMLAAAYVDHPDYDEAWRP